ncbi:MAG: exosortase E/protease, VPEID-CTERM system [Alphaproteobacteria bacterium]|nr:exosortase E/protease, VPEID-CTERM system [Alphaproteobacteria bacterium]
MNAAISSADFRVITRGVILSLVLLAEVVAIDGGYSFRSAVVGDAPLWQFVNETLQAFIYAALYAGMAFCVLALAHGREVLSAWVGASGGHMWLPWFIRQSTLFALILFILPWIETGAEHAPWTLFSIWVFACVSMSGCAALAIAPLSFWREQGAKHAPNAVAALVAGISIYAAVNLSRESWSMLADATLGASHWILSAYESNAFADESSRILGAGDFKVVIDAPCAGYEGMGLVLGVLGFYIFAFRRELRFPHALALLPIGVAAIWLLNALRLALLVSIGAHISPDLALQGFHSQAGWIFFLLVTISLMFIAHRTPALRAGDHAAAPRDPAIKLAAALLIPFAALMASRIAASIFGEGPNWPAVLAIALPAAALIIYRAEIGRQLGRVTLEPVALGAAVGAFWIVTHSYDPSGYTLGRWLELQPAPAAGAWIVLRVIGFALIVPFAEELAFRGYLHRALIGRRFEKVAPHTFSWLAFVVTTVLFGLLHQRWLSGAVAGAVFAIALYRSKSLAGPITAHVGRQRRDRLLRGRAGALGPALNPNKKSAGLLRRS